MSVCHKLVCDWFFVTFMHLHNNVQTACGNVLCDKLPQHFYTFYLTLSLIAVNQLYMQLCTASVDLVDH